MKYRVSWENNGKRFEKMVNKSQLANLIQEITMWGHKCTVEEA